MLAMIDDRVSEYDKTLRLFWKSLMCRCSGGVSLPPISVEDELRNERTPLFHFQFLQPVASGRKIVSGVESMSVHRRSPIRDLRAFRQLCNQPHRSQVRVRL